MVSDWDSAPLGDLVEEIFDRRGVTPTKLGSAFVSIGHRVISAKTIKNRHVDLSADDPRFVDDATFAKWMRNPLRADDVILTSEAPLGEPAYVASQTDWCLGQRLFGIRTIKERLDGRFLFYALQGDELRHDLLSRATGTTAQGIRQSELRRVRIPLPDLDEQRAIVYILGSLDDKIELNRQMNETLEAIARALFKSWFVDFDPVRAKADGRDPGLPKHVADLFPTRLVGSELGEVPEGWRVGTLADFASPNPETWSKETRPALIKYVDLSNIKWGRVDAVVTYEQTKAPSRAQRVLRSRDTIVGTVRPGNGSFALVSEDGLTGSTGFAVLRPRKIEYAEFVYCAATAAENIAALSRLADGGAYPALRPEVVIATSAINSGNEVIAAYSHLAQPFLARMAENERQSRNLAAVRDTLLPKLVSGELRIKNLDKFVGLASDLN